MNVIVRQIEEPKFLSKYIIELDSDEANDLLNVIGTHDPITEAMVAKLIVITALAPIEVVNEGVAQIEKQVKDENNKATKLLVLKLLQAKRIASDNYAAYLEKQNEKK